MAKPHTIVIVANTAWNIYNFRVGLYRFLQSCGFDVITMGMPDKYAPKLREAGIRFVALENMIPSQISWLKDLDLIKEMSVKLKEFHPDMLLLFTAKPNIYGNFVASKMDIPTISTLTGVGSVFTLGGWRAKGISKMYNIALKNSKAVVFHNEDDLELFRDNKIINRAMGLVIPGSGIDTKRIKAMAVNRDKTRTFLLMARMIEDKGISEFIRASAKMSEAFQDVRFVMIGERPEADKRTIPEREIAQWTKYPGCEYHHFVEDVFPYIEAADIVVLPSWREGMPRVVLEAMAVGRPVLATDVPGCRQAVEDGITGLLVPARSEQGLYEGLLEMYEKPIEELQVMGDKGRKRVEKLFDSPIIYKAYLELIRHILPIYKRLFY